LERIISTASISFLDLGAVCFLKREDVRDETNDFRRYQPFIAKDRSGNAIEMILCEEMDTESARWEPFYAIKGIEDR